MSQNKMTEKEYTIYVDLKKQGLSLKEIATKLNYEGKRIDTSLRNRVSAYEKNYGDVRHLNEVEPIENNKKNEIIKKSDDNIVTANFFTNKENLDILIDLVNREKNRIEESQNNIVTSVIMIDDIVLKGEQVRKTYRVSKEIDNAFTQFAKDNNHHTKIHLLSQAMFEFIEKYK